jgi:selenide,water dikinase
LRDLPSFPDDRLIIGSATSDDAAVYLLDSERALVQTLDFFTPIVDDPFLYGQIAATNSLSDVYAMGGRPITAMNILGVPEEVTLEMANEILKGGAEKVKEARCALAGGHSIKNPEPIYGLSVTGLVHPKKVISNAGARPGDILVLTKPLGNGIIATAVKRQICPDGLESTAIAAMVKLNTPGAVLAEKGITTAGTDITGFGLLGHLGSLCRSSGVLAELDASKFPMIAPEVADLIASGCVPGGTKANLRHASGDTDFGQATEIQQILLADAQTSGGLLLCIPPARLTEAMDLLHAENVLCQAIVGRILPQTGVKNGEKRIRLV